MIYGSSTYRHSFFAVGVKKSSSKRRYQGGGEKRRQKVSSSNVKICRKHPEFAPVENTSRHNSPFATETCAFTKEGKTISNSDALDCNIGILILIR